MKIIFRADGNSKIGAGHVMRCLSIAKAALKQGHECIFISADQSFLSEIHRQGFKCIILNSNYEALDQELENLVNIIKEERPNLILVDSYFITEHYLSTLKEQCRVAYIDDFMSIAFPVDVLINYGILASVEQYNKIYSKVDPKPCLVIGSRYIPLREEFQGDLEINIRDQVGNILFSAGGADHARIALKFLKQYLKEKIPTTLNMILGKFEPDLEEIKEIATQHSHIKIHYNVQEMAKLMKQNDLAISAAGSTLNELCACGIPTITYVLEDNQLMGAKGYAEQNAMIYAGDYRNQLNFFENLMKIVQELSNDPNKRRALATNARSIVDGKGAERLVKELCSKLE